MGRLFQCQNSDCSGGNGLSYIFDSTIPVCPKCGAKPPNIGTVVHMHLAYYDKTGPLMGYQNKKVKVACGAKNYADPFNCITDYIPLINCPQCLKSEAYKQLWYPDLNDLRSYYNSPHLTADEKEKLWAHP